MADPFYTSTDHIHHITDMPSGQRHVAVRATSAASLDVLSPASEASLPLTDHPATQMQHVPDPTWSPTPFPTQASYFPLISPREEIVPDPVARALLLQDPVLCMADAEPQVNHIRTMPTLFSHAPLPFRLPPFDTLGITMPRTLQQPSATPAATVGSQCPRAMGCGAGILQEAGKSLFASVPTSFQPLDFTTLTPPDEVPALEFSALTSEAGDIPSSGIAGSPVANHEYRPSAIASADEASGTRLANIPVWLREAAVHNLRGIQTMQPENNHIRILSQALPSPCANGHIFPSIIEEVRTTAPMTHSLTWINVFHAVSGRFNLADLPTSPPTTPGVPFGGDDYFTAKVFDSAVPITDYANDNIALLSAQPQPAVAPGSIDLSIVERIVPPASRREFANMFDPRGSQSLLADRLIELSPHSGTLLFIYPTLRGGRTFLDHYLGPVLDPILRSMVVIHDLSANFSTTVGQMPVLAELLTYETLEKQIRHFCESLGQSEQFLTACVPSPRSSPRAGTGFNDTAKFTLEYAAAREVQPPRSVWASWWTKQDKTRIRNAVTRYFHGGRQESANFASLRSHDATSSGSRSSQPEISQAAIIQAILDGIENKPITQIEQPPIEVGVFVIRRTK